MSESTTEKSSITGDVCWLEIPVTDMARCQTFYKAVFGWEFNNPPGSPEGKYAMFSKPNTKLSGGLYHVEEDNMIRPQVDQKGEGQATNRIVMKVEEVDAALKVIEAAGGQIITGKTAVGDMGYYGSFRDTEGNINGVFSKK